MKKNISIFILSLLCILPSCDIIKDELGLNDDDKEENKGNNNDNKKPQVNVNKNPCAYFTFDGTYDDLSGNNNYSYGNPDPKFVDGPVSGKRAIAFSRADLTKVVVNKALIDSPSMSVSFWLKDISEGNIFYVTTSSGRRQMFLGYREGHLKYVMSRSNNQYETSYDFTSTGNFTHKVIDDGEWHHIVLVSDFNSKKSDNITTSLYIDGIIMDTLTEYYAASNEESDNYRHFGVGTKFVLGGDNTPNMKIANLRVYDEWQLPESEIKNLYNKNL